MVLMGVEMIGLARANMEEVGIDPTDCQPELRGAVSLLGRRGARTMIYNHQLFLVDCEPWPFTVRSISISDWKNEYHPERQGCAVKERCSEFFFSAKYRHSEGLKAIAAEDSQALLQV